MKQKKIPYLILKKIIKLPKLKNVWKNKRYQRELSRRVRGSNNDDKTAVLYQKLKNKSRNPSNNKNL